MTAGVGGREFRADGQISARINMLPDGQCRAKILALGKHNVLIAEHIETDIAQAKRQALISLQAHLLRQAVSMKKGA